MCIGTDGTAAPSTACCAPWVYARMCTRGCTTTKSHAAGVQLVRRIRGAYGGMRRMVYTVVVAIFTLLVAVVVLASLATQLRVPYAILLVLGGLVLGFVPGLPTVTLDPAVVLFLFLPPLIYFSAWFTPWRDFRADLRPILLLAVGLVLTCTTL